MVQDAEPAVPVFEGGRFTRPPLYPFSTRLHAMRADEVLYGTLSIGLIALAIFSARNTLRVLRAVELLSSERSTQ